MLKDVIEALSTRELSKGCLAYGLKEDNGKFGEVIPWQDSFQVTELSILGAMCFVRKKSMEDVQIQNQYNLLSAALGQDPEVWNDDPQTTKKQVIDFLESVSEKCV